MLSLWVDPGVSLSTSRIADSHLTSGMVTIMTRPMLSISVLYLHLLLGAGDSECGINVSQSEFLSNSHQPQT